MIKFNINKPDGKIHQNLYNKINNLAKPKGSLGMLEELALQIGDIQQTLKPELKNPYNVLLGADHGIADEGVSFSPKEVTWQQMFSFIRGTSGINFLCRQHGFNLLVVDAGVDYDFPKDIGILDMKVAHGTKNFLYKAAMSEKEFDLAIERGAKVIQDINAKGCNVVSFGEMGIGNTSPSAMWMHYFASIPLESCVGAGSGLNNSGISKKLDVLRRSEKNYEDNMNSHFMDKEDIIEKIRYFGGLEMVMALGGMLKAAELHMVIIVDGFIMSACILAASKLYPEVLKYAVFGHQGDEAGHKLLLNAMLAKPILHLGLRLGEGTGAVCAYPIIDSAVRMLREMGSFDSAAITKYY